MKKLIIALAAVLTFAGCSDFLEPLPNGHYTDKNLLEYPSMIRGRVTVRSRFGGSCRVRWKDDERSLDFRPGEEKILTF